MKKRNKLCLLAAVLAIIMLFSACGGNGGAPISNDESQVSEGYAYTASAVDVPSFDGETAYIAINNNVPNFSESDLTTQSYEKYSDLDSLGRCGVAMACVGRDIMPTEERESIGQVKPTGWHTVKYDIVDGKYLYNRCHLIGFQLTGENANPQNLITGTRYLNIEGMLPFENLIADYVKETGNHVIYRVTPVFDGDNLLSKGVQMEGLSVEDDGEGVCFNVFAYNAQPGISINYANGESMLSDNGGFDSQGGGSSVSDVIGESEKEYVLNTKSKKFHLPSCKSIDDIAPQNKKIITKSKEELVNEGYSGCKNCNP